MSQDTYRAGERQKKRRVWPLWLGGGLLVMGLVAAMVVLGLRFLNPRTTIKQAQPVISKVVVATPPIQHIKEPSFILDLPSDWKLESHVTQPYNLYRWISGGKSTGTYMIEVYQDVIPQSFAVNRVLPIEAAVDRITVPGGVSDNCADFTKSAPALGQDGTKAKWQGIDFLCDLNNTTRNVVGTSSAGAINSVTLKNNRNQSHSFFFTFTDHSINPDYTKFINALNSFRLQ